ncbi:hypothetical protein [Pedosphaera parvula]|uniref:Uncharacterized protein n=1 Tax=Pedosphaera parvula (strain Ellin514) TaxID=320771 RepID=B9XHW1_PEDPL|nr:hypothetical protein [Pedosphaera parvula]EEF60454.1 hypothetical protein Cflav_PD3424 [Pedosphaera parvula Ellin514]
MKATRGIGLLAFTLVTLATFISKQDNKGRLVLSVVSASAQELLVTNTPTRLRNLLQPIKVADLTGAERAELAIHFKEKFKPAIEKWCKAYEGHVPFRPEDVSSEKFSERLENYSYSFVIDGIKLTIHEINGVARVLEMETPAAKTLLQPRKEGTVPNVKVSITSDEVIRMVTADTGIEFKPEQVSIEPTGETRALNGGAMVEVGRPRQGISFFADKNALILAFGADGMLVGYGGFGVLPTNNSDSALGKPVPQTVTCVRNLLQIGLSFRMWAGDNQDEYPFNISTKEGGTKELCRLGKDGFDLNAGFHFQVASNELNNPLVLVCPQDTSRKPARDWVSLKTENVTYRLRSGTNINEASPKTILAVCPIDGNTLWSDGSVTEGEHK